jgi:myosin protein heavy chain
LNSKLKQIESEKELLQEQLEEEEESKKNMEKQIVALNLQITESRKKMEEEAEQSAAMEASYKKMIKVCIIVVYFKSFVYNLFI